MYIVTKVLLQVAGHTVPDDFFEKIRVNPISERLTPFEQKYSPKTRK